MTRCKRAVVAVIPYVQQYQGSLNETTESGDLFHVAAALELAAEYLYSFDQQQRKTGASGRPQGQLRPHQGPHSSSQPHTHGRGHGFAVYDSPNLVLCVDGFMDNSRLKPSKAMIH